MNDFEIDIIDDEDKAEHESVQLPMNYLLIGELENDDAKVYIKQDVYKALEEYASSDTAHELGTIILGNYSDELGKMNVVISDFIYAKYTDASASTLTFTHETWEYVHKEHEEKYPNTKIVGWQHTHPGYGIFLSNYDMFIQENFFNMPFQVAYVIDPVQHIRGFFQWKNGKVEKLKGFFIYDELGKTIKIDQPKEKHVSNEKLGAIAPKENRSSIWQPLILGVLGFAVIALLISTISLHKRYDRQIEDQEALELQIAQQNTLISQQAEELEAVKANVSKVEIFESTKQEEKEPESTQQEVAGNSESEEKPSTDEKTEEKSEEPVEEKTEDKTEEQSENRDNRVYFASYLVEAGDTLTSICRKNNLDYASNYRIILSMNGITDADQIFVGQTILLPIHE